MTDEFVMNDAISLELELPGPPEWDEIWDGTRSDHYDRKGNPLTMREWSALFARKDYQIIKQEYVGDYWISTIWLGIDHGWGRGRPLIFETMVFNHSKPKPPRPPIDVDISFPPTGEFKEWLEDYPEQTSSSDVECERYSTEEEALDGHQRMVDRVRLLVDFTTLE